MYIDADKMVDIIHSFYVGYRIEDMIYCIKKNASVDIECNKAEWVYDHWCEFKCSNCGNWSNSKPYKGRERYCPECGAKMKNGSK